MKVLMVTPMVDEKHPILGFIPNWIRAIAEKVEELHIITLNQNKKTVLPNNVFVYVLDYKKGILKEKFFLFFTLLNLLFKNIDVLFCHMYPSLAIKVAPFGRLIRVPVVWWRTHGSMSLKVRIVHFLATRVVTASKSSFQIESKKIKIIGHGIDVNKFKPVMSRRQNNKFIILSVGRISPVKNYETLIKAVNYVCQTKKSYNIEYLIIGSVPMKSQESYYKKLQKLVKELKLTNTIKFIGSVPYTEIESYYQKCDVVICASQTNSLDKTVLESMACGKPVITSNLAYYQDVFDKELKKRCYFKKNNYVELVQKIEYFLDNDHKDMQKKLREIVIANHSLNSLSDSLLSVFQDVSNSVG